MLQAGGLKTLRCVILARGPQAPRSHTMGSTGLRPMCPQALGCGWVRGVACEAARAAEMVN